jgi:hypothetical protein
MTGTEKIPSLLFNDQHFKKNKHKTLHDMNFFYLFSQFSFLSFFFLSLCLDVKRTTEKKKEQNLLKFNRLDREQSTSLYIDGSSVWRKGEKRKKKIDT